MVLEDVLFVCFFLQFNTALSLHVYTGACSLFISAVLHQHKDIYIYMLVIQNDGRIEAVKCCTPGVILHSQYVAIGKKHILH